MKQIERLKHIYLKLSESPQEIKSLQSSFNNIGIDVSTRQLYRDIIDVSNFLLQAGETIEQYTQEYNRKLWVLKRNTNAEPISDYDIDTYIISRAIVPLSLRLGRKASLHKIYSLLNENLANSKVQNKTTWDGGTLINSHFYDVPFDAEFQERLDKIIWATTNYRRLIIESYSGDSVSLHKSTVFPITYNPLKIIFHRNSFFVAGIDKAQNKILVLDIYQIRDFTLSNDTFKFKRQKAQVDDNLKQRFGVTQNIDDKVYKIILEFSSTTGMYVENHIWHNSQTFEILENGNYLLKLKCGINRELVGWIFQWMGNVKILQPSILKQYYQTQLKQMLSNSTQASVEYSNIFQPE